MLEHTITIRVAKNGNTRIWFGRREVGRKMDGFTLKTYRRGDGGQWFQEHLIDPFGSHGLMMEKREKAKILDL